MYTKEGGVKSTLSVDIYLWLVHLIKCHPLSGLSNIALFPFACAPAVSYRPSHPLSPPVYTSLSIARIFAGRNNKTSKFGRLLSSKGSPSSGLVGGSELDSLRGHMRRELNYVNNSDPTVFDTGCPVMANKARNLSMFNS